MKVYRKSLHSFLVILPIDFQTDRQTQSHIIVGNVVDAALGLDSTIDHVRDRYCEAYIEYDPQITLYLYPVTSNRPA